MENLIHGANPENLFRAFNLDIPEKIIDFSTNTNILAWPKIDIDVERLASSYPDPECRKLRELISQREGISPSRILFTNGINEAIFLLAELFFYLSQTGRRTGAAYDTITERDLPKTGGYGNASGLHDLSRRANNVAILHDSDSQTLTGSLKRTGGTRIFPDSHRQAGDVATLPASGRRASLAILQPCYLEYSRAFIDACDIFSLDEAGNFRAVILVNPNNPTGSYITNLSDTLKLFPDTLFIIDEAYIDFVLSCDKRERLCDFDNVIILRSLTKIFHLSGVRIGYVIANENIIARLKSLQPTWSVNAVAQELALRFLNDTEFYEHTRAFYRETTPKFIASLKQSGAKIMNSAVHYFLIEIDNDIEFMKFLLRHGIAVRHTRNFRGLDGKYIRVSTRYPDENDLLARAILLWTSTRA